MYSTYSAKVSPGRVRLPNESDRGTVDQSLRRAIHLSLEATVSYLCTDIDYVVDSIVTNELTSVVLDEAYLLVYTVGSPWYSKELVVSEDMVLRIGKGSSFSVVTDYLDDLAEKYDAKIQITGGALARHHRAITRMYERAGYSTEPSPQFIKRRR